MFSKKKSLVELGYSVADKESERQTMNSKDQVNKKGDTPIPKTRRVSNQGNFGRHQVDSRPVTPLTRNAIQHQNPFQQQKMPPRYCANQPVSITSKSTETRVVDGVNIKIVTTTTKYIKTTETPSLLQQYARNSSVDYNKSSGCSSATGSCRQVYGGNLYPQPMEIEQHENIVLEACRDMKCIGSSMETTPLVNMLQKANFEYTDRTGDAKRNIKVTNLDETRSLSLKHETSNKQGPRESQHNATMKNMGHDYDVPSNSRHNIDPRHSDQVQNHSHNLLPNDKQNIRTNYYQMQNLHPIEKHNFNEAEVNSVPVHHFPPNKEKSSEQCLNLNLNEDQNATTIPTGVIQTHSTQINKTEYKEPPGPDDFIKIERIDKNAEHSDARELRNIQDEKEVYEKFIKEVERSYKFINKIKYFENLQEFEEIERTFNHISGSLLRSIDKLDRLEIDDKEELDDTRKRIFKFIYGLHRILRSKAKEYEERSGQTLAKYSYHL